MFSSLSYSMMLISWDSNIDPHMDHDQNPEYNWDSKLELNGLHMIHPWYYVQRIIKKYSNVINWSELIRNLPGTRSQVLRMIEHIGAYLKTREDLYTIHPMVHYKLDYKTLRRLVRNLKPVFSNDYFSFRESYVSDRNVKSIYKQLIQSTYNHDCAMEQAIGILYRNRCSHPEFRITSRNWIEVIYVLQYYPQLAQLPWLVDIQKYLDLISDSQKYILMHLYANPKIDRDIFMRFTESNLHIKTDETLLYKHIRNMFRFRMKTGLGLTLYYPPKGIKEDTVEWRMKLYELNLGLIDSGILYGCSSLIHAIPGRHSQYIHYDLVSEHDYPYTSDLERIRLLLE